MPASDCFLETRDCEVILLVERIAPVTFTCSCKSMFQLQINPSYTNEESGQLGACKEQLRKSWF